MSRLLVIKHGALGDLIQALGPCAAIRNHHPDAQITLLTTPPFVEFLTKAPYFDRIVADDRPSLTRPLAWLRLARWLRAEKFTRVYDLQTSNRSALYFRLLAAPKPDWSGVAVGCSHPDPDPARKTLHTIDRQAGQLRAAGITQIPLSDLSWVSAALDGFSLPDRYAVLVPGGSAHRPAKRWPHFAALAARLVEAGVTPVLIGTKAEASTNRSIAATVPQSQDLTGQTSFAQITELGRGAALVVGNDTGPMHILATAGAPALVLFSAESDPARFAPRTTRTAVLREPDLANLSLEQVWAEAQALVPAIP